MEAVPRPRTEPTEGILYYSSSGFKLACPDQLRAAQEQPPQGFVLLNPMMMEGGSDIDDDELPGAAV
jgi:hypothetical protein